MKLRNNLMAGGGGALTGPGKMGTPGLSDFKGLAHNMFTPQMYTSPKLAFSCSAASLKGS